MKRPKYNEHEIELGRRIAAAVISVQMRISVQTAYLNYTKDKPIDDSWVEVGKLLLPLPNTFFTTDKPGEEVDEA